LLELTYRQTTRIWSGIDGGATGLQHAKRERHSNRADGEEFQRSVLRRMQERYEDFGTLAAEHLASHVGWKVHAGMVPRRMKQAGMWHGHRRRKPCRQPR